MIDAQILAFAAIAALLTITPGPDTVLVVRSVLARGRRAGFLTVLGICCGLFVHATLSAVGLSVILVRSATLFEIVRLAGAVYLVILGAQSVRAALRSPAPDRAGAAESRLRGRRAFVEGLVNNVLNPKVAVFYLAFLPQFIAPGDAALARSMLLAAIHFLEGVVWLSAVTLLVARLRRGLAHARVQRALEAVTGLVLVGFGLRLAVDRR